jgi:hypothetical protein
VKALLRELLAAHRIVRHPEVAATLQALRLPAEGVPVWGVDSVAVERGYYAPDPAGHPAIIVPAFDDGGLIDLTATGLASRRVATRTGIAAVLGQEVLDRALVDQVSLHLFRDPVEWLQHRGAGAVVLDWRTAPFILTDLAGIACTTALLAARIDKALRQPLRVPPLFVREQRRAAA